MYTACTVFIICHDVCYIHVCMRDRETGLYSHFPNHSDLNVTSYNSLASKPQESHLMTMHVAITSLTQDLASILTETEGVHWLVELVISQA